MLRADVCHMAKEMGKPKESQGCLHGQGGFSVLLCKTQSCAQSRNLKGEMVDEFRNSL